MRAKGKHAEYRLLSGLFFRLLPFQVLLLAISAVNGIVDSVYASNVIGKSAMSAIGLFGPFNHFLYAASMLFVSGTQMLYNGRKPTKASEQFENVKKEVSSYKKDENTLVFVSAGRLSKEKNFPLMLSAFQRLENENVTLLILGSGDRDQFEDIRPANAHFLGPRNNVGDYMLCADAFCLSSSWEGFPITVIEAMSAGIPILSTRAGGVPDVVKNGVNGLLSDDMSVEAYEKILKKFISLSELEKEEISRNNSGDFSAKYDISICADKYLEVYGR